MLGEILHVLGLYLSSIDVPGGEFVHSLPGYTALVDAGRACGRASSLAYRSIRKLENDLPAIADRINTRTRAVYLVNPHNPSGTVSDAIEFIEFVRRLSRQTLVIVDEAYLEFTPDFEERTVACLGSRRRKRRRVPNPFSKIYGLASLAFGYVLAPQQLASALSRIGIGAFFDVNRLNLVAAHAGLADANYVATMRESVRTERQAWHDLFRKHDVPYANAQANFVFSMRDDRIMSWQPPLLPKGSRSAAASRRSIRGSAFRSACRRENIIVRQAVENLLR